MKALLRRVGAWIRRLVRGVFRLVVAVLLVLIAALALFAFVGTTVGYPFDRSGQALPKGTVAGAYHVHSTLSDGRGTPEEIAQAAANTGLAFVVLTDHNLAALAPTRFVEGVLLISASEISTPVGHLVVLGGSGPVPRDRGADAVKAARELGGAPLLAHPIQWKMPWSDWSQARGAAGLELYSADTMLREALHSPFSRLIPAAGAYVTNPQHALLSLVEAQPEATRRLIDLTAERPRAALCANDAHGIPAYEDAFRAMAMVLPSITAEGGLGTDPDEAGRRVQRALAEGRGYCLFRALGDGTGFALEGLGPDRTLKVGEMVKVQLPRNTPSEVRVQVTGAADLLPDGRTVRARAAGAAQVEVWRRAPGRLLGSDWRPWLVPSPIRITD